MIKTGSLLTLDLSIWTHIASSHIPLGNQSLTTFIPVQIFSRCPPFNILHIQSGWDRKSSEIVCLILSCCKNLYHISSIFETSLVQSEAISENTNDMSSMKQSLKVCKWTSSRSAQLRTVTWHRLCEVPSRLKIRWMTWITWMTSYDAGINLNKITELYCVSRVETSKKG